MDPSTTFGAEYLQARDAGGFGARDLTPGERSRNLSFLYCLEDSTVGSADSTVCLGWHGY